MEGEAYQSPCAYVGAFSSPVIQPARRVRPTKLNSPKVQELVRGPAVGPSQEISMHKDGNEIVETAVEARGGLLGRPVLLVLLVSCVLAVAALIVTY